MKYENISQFYPASANDLIQGDDQQFGLMPVASSLQLMVGLRERGYDIIALPEPLLALRQALQIPDSITVAFTFILPQELPERTEGHEYLDENESALGFCVSYGEEEEDSSRLEVFVAIEPSRVAIKSPGDDLSDDEIEEMLDLNHFAITQVLLGLGEYEDDTAEASDTGAISQDSVDALEARSSTLLETLLDDDGPLFALVPHDDEDEDEE